MASTAALNKVVAACCIVLILTMGQLMLAADASPHQLQGSRRHLLQLAEREVVAVARQPGFKNGRNVVAKQPGFQNAAVRNSANSPAARGVRINGPPN